MREFENQADFIGIGARDTVDSLEEFVRKYELEHFPNVSDPNASLWGDLGVRGQPTWIFVFSDGTSETLFRPPLDQVREILQRMSER